MLIEQVFDELQNEKLCDNAYDFSVRYLGKSKSYYSVIKARNEMPSIAAIATLEMALKNTVFLFSNSSHPVINKTHQSLQELYGKVGHYRESRSQAELADKAGVQAVSQASILATLAGLQLHHQ